MARKRHARSRECEEKAQACGAEQRMMSVHRIYDEPAVAISYAEKQAHMVLKEM